MASVPTPPASRMKVIWAGLRDNLPFHLALLLFGVGSSGVAGLAIPRLAGTAGLANLAWAAFYLGTMVGSLLFGSFAPRFGKLHLLLFGFGGAILGMASLTLLRGPLMLAATALLGIGGAAVQITTVLLVRAWYPHDQWDEQIGTMQTWMGAGQVVGLLLTNVTRSPAQSAIVGAAVLAVALLVALRLTAPAESAVHPREMRHHVTVQLLEHAALAHVYHLAHVRPADLAAVESKPLPRLLTRWALLMLASIPVGNVIPLLLQQNFGFDRNQIGTGIAIISAIAVLEYRPAGHACKRRGAARVLQVGGLLRALGMGIIALSLASRGPGLAAFVGYAFMVIAWSPLSIASTIYAGECCSTEHAGATIGVYNAIGALARIGGSLLGTVLVVPLGYTWMTAVCAVIVLVAALIPGPAPAPIEAAEAAPMPRMV